jgi:putative sterol carrier protein
MCAQPAANESDPTTQLFNRISRGGREDSLADVEGRLRFDLNMGDHVEQWAIDVHYGQITVSRDATEPDCVVALDKELLDRIATGQANAMSALLRADIVVSGDVRLLVLLERLLPGPAGARGPQRVSHSPGAG